MGAGRALTSETLAVKERKSELWASLHERLAGTAGARDLAELQDIVNTDYTEAYDIIEALYAYGEAKFGDEFWPGNSHMWINAKQAEILGSEPQDDDV